MIIDIDKERASRVPKPITKVILPDTKDGFDITLSKNTKLYIRRNDLGFVIDIEECGEYYDEPICICDPDGAL